MTAIATPQGRAGSRPALLRPPVAVAAAVLGIVTALLAVAGVVPAAATALVAAALLIVAAAGCFSARGVNRRVRLLAAAAAAVGALALVTSSAGREVPASMAAAVAAALALAAVAAYGSGTSTGLALLDGAVAAVAVVAVSLEAGPPVSPAVGGRIAAAALLAAALAARVARSRPPVAVVAGMGGFLLGSTDALRVLAAAAVVLAVAGATVSAPVRVRRHGSLLVSAVPVVVLVAVVAARSPGDPLLVGLAATAALTAVRLSVGLRVSRREEDAERDRLLAAVAHDLRTPLTAVAGFADVLSDGWESLPDAERRDMLAIVRGEAHRLARMVGDLTLLARDELDAVALERSRFDGKGLIAEAVSLVFDLSAGPPPVRARVEPYLELVGDRARILEAVTALLDNAYRYGGGRVLVVARREDGRRILEVHDDGIGIDSRDVGVLWERFRRGSQDDGRVAGAGLGLARVRALAHAHGGEASYRPSEELGGACFSLDLPYGVDGT